MNLSALESSLKSLEMSSDSLEAWLTWSTLLVVIGLIIEYWHEVPEAVRDIQAGKNVWKALCLILGGVLITLGVAGELIFESRLAASTGQARSKTHEIESLLNDKASSADREAEEARERAATLAKQAAVLHKRAEDEAMARVKLETILGPRNLTVEQRRQLREKLGHLSGTEVDVFVFGGNEWHRFEEFRFAKILSAALGKRGAGLDIREYWGACEPPEPIFGVAVFGFADTPMEDQQASSEIKRALKSVRVDVSEWTLQVPNCDLFTGLEASEKPRDHPGWANIKIIVGLKPDPMLARPTFPVPYH